MEAGELSRTEHAEGFADGLDADADHLLEEVLAVGGEDALDDAAVVLGMPSFAQPVPLHAVDEAGRGRRTELEGVRDRAHRLGAGAEEHEQSELAEGQVADKRRRHDPGHAPEDLEQVDGGFGQSRVLGGWFRHPRIVRGDVKYRQDGDGRRQQGFPALPRWSGVNACSHTMLVANRSCVSARSRTFPTSATARTKPPRAYPAGRRTRARSTAPAMTIDGATM